MWMWTLIAIMKWCAERCSLQFYRTSLNVWKFELQYEWTSPQTFFCRYRILQPLRHNVEGAHAIKCNKK